MLKKVNQIRRSLSKGSGDKQEKKEEKKKKTNQKKVNQGSQTDETETTKNVNKKLDFLKVSIKDKSKKMEENNKPSNNLKVPNLAYIDDGESDEEIQEKVIEEPFPNTVKILESENGSKVYLIGTAHFSEESCKDVEYVIRRVVPDVVVLEICQERMATLILDEDVLMKRIMDFTFDQASDIIKSYGLLQGIIQILFLYVSKEITKQTGKLPGCEIRKAIKESEKIPHCVCHLGDRPFQITFRRAIGSLTFYQKFKLAFSIFFSNPKMSKEEVENYKQNDILEEYLKEFGENYPMMKKALVDERDMYLAYSLQVACRLTPRNKNEFYTQRLKVSRNSLASVEQHLNSCKHELDNLRKIKSKSTNPSSPTGDQPDSQQLFQNDSQIENYQMKLEKLENQYNKLHQQVISDTENLSSFSQPLNANPDAYRPSVVVGIVGMGHMNGIQRFFNKVSAKDVQAILEIPNQSMRSKVVGKVIKYTFYSFMIYGLCRYAIPSSAKAAIVDLSSKTVTYSKEFISDKLLKK